MKTSEARTSRRRRCVRAVVGGDTERRQLGPERVLDLPGVSGNHRVLCAEDPIRPVVTSSDEATRPSRHELVAQRGRRLGAEEGVGGFERVLNGERRISLSGMTAVELTPGWSVPAFQLRSSGHRCLEIGDIDVVLPWNTDESEQA